MYIHIGNNKIIDGKKIIGIFDMDFATLSKYTRKTLGRIEKEKKVESVSFDIPRSIVVTDEKIYLSPLSPKALSGRGEKY